MNLDEAVRRARDVLARDDRGNLKVGARRAIWAALGGRDDPAPRRAPGGTPGSLAASCIERDRELVAEGRFELPTKGL